MLASSGSEVNISGGEVGGAFLASAGSNVNLFGTAFVLNGVLLDNLVEGQTITIVERDMPLIGQHADGSTFSFILNSDPPAFADGFAFGATLTVTLVPELEVLLGDVDRNGVVDFSDISPFIAVLAANGDQAEADTNEDGLVDFSDIGPFISLLSSLLEITVFLRSHKITLPAQIPFGCPKSLWLSKIILAARSI